MQTRLNQLKVILGVGFLFVIVGCNSIPGNPQHATRENPQGYRHLADPGTITATEMHFDAKSGEVRYTLPVGGYVQIRAGLNHAGALLNNFVDWEYREAGQHVEVWDKKDATGKIFFGDRSDYLLVLNARTKDAKAGFPKSPRFTIGFPGTLQKNPEGTPIVSGIVPLRALIHPEDIKRLSQSPFEVAIYIDYVFLMEDEVATNPFNYLLDVSQLADGDHVVTLNVISYSGLIGTASIKIRVHK